MDISLIVFVLLQIFTFYKAEENCSIQHCKKCANLQMCNLCELDRFGHECEYKCRANSSICSICRDFYLKMKMITDEVCFNCSANEYFLNGTCIPCREEYFGTNCSETCPKNCLKCISHNLCISCKNGWSGKVCQCSTNCKQTGNEDEWCSEDGVCLKGCTSGKHGKRCDLECINKERCLSCNQSNGHCLHCSEEWHGSFCNETCRHCQADKENLTKCNISTRECNDTCTDGHYGPSCDEKCGHCLPNETERDLTSSKTCDKISGKCLFGCKQGWFGVTCKNKCSNCLHENCNQISGKCIDGCVRGWSGDFCRNICNLTCANGTCDAFSSFCNEGCVSGRYGNTCNEICNNACVNMSCVQDSGYCIHGCVSGWYGSTCNKMCNAACVNTSCYNDSGYCVHGCVSGRYGEKCEYRCSKSCKDDTCDQQTAKCSFGCKTYFKGPLCNVTETLEILLNPGFTKVIIGAAGCVSLIACVLIASPLVRKCLRGKQCCSPKKSTSTDLFSVHQHIDLYQDIGGNTSTPPVYEDIDGINHLIDTSFSDQVPVFQDNEDVTLETSFNHAYDTRSDLLREKTQVPCSRNCTSGIYYSPWDLKWSAQMIGATGAWFDNNGGKQVDISVTRSDDLEGGYEILSPAEDADTASKANHFGDLHGNGN